MAGRLTIGVPRGILRYWWSELRRMSEPVVAAQWLVHLVLSELLRRWLFGVVGTSKALANGIAVAPAVLVGVVTAVGGGALRDVAPTLLHMMGLPQPPEMTGRPLIEFV